MNLEDLKQGDEFYDVTRDRITKYEYLMKYPFKNPENVKSQGYHIVLMKSLDEPKRVYYTWLQVVLAKGILTYEQAKFEQVRLVENHLKDLKETK